MKVLFLVDSNLKSLKVGLGCSKIRPYLRVDGVVLRLFVADNMPSNKYIMERDFTDVVVNLGINHAKFGPRRMIGGKDAIVRFFQDVRERLPSVRCYYLKSPPSVDPQISANVAQFNKMVVDGVRSSNVAVIDMPSLLYGEAGCLKARYASEWTTKLHYTDEAKGMVVSKISRWLELVSGTKIGRDRTRKRKARS